MKPSAPLVRPAVYLFASVLDRYVQSCHIEVSNSSATNKFKIISDKQHRCRYNHTTYVRYIYFTSTSNYTSLTTLNPHPHLNTSYLQSPPPTTSLSTPPPDAHLAHG